MLNFEVLCLSLILPLRYDSDLEVSIMLTFMHDAYV